MWRVKYEDSDEEDLYAEELRPLLTPENPALRTQRYIKARQRAIDLFTYYPVLNTRYASDITHTLCILYDIVYDTHTHTLTHTRTRTLTHTHTHTHTHVHTHTRTYTHTILTHTRTYTRAHTAIFIPSTIIGDVQ